MKKLLLVSLLACLATGSFAIDLSAGISATVGGFSQTTLYEPYTILLWTIDSYRETVSTVPLSCSIYFDATYGILSFGFSGNGDPHRTIKTIDGGTTNTTETDLDARSGFLRISVLGRYPFRLGPVVLFPLAGIEYALNLYHKQGDGTDLKESMSEQEKTDLNQFWFKFGAGTDITLYKGLYLRPQVLLGFKLLNAGEKQAIQNAISDGATTARITDFVFEGGVQAGWRF
jgi:hypothetical protein